MDMSHITDATNTNQEQPTYIASITAVAVAAQNTEL